MQCDICHRELAAKAPVWRDQRRHERPNSQPYSRYWIFVTLCRNCTSRPRDRHRWLKLAPCAACERPVFNLRKVSPRHRFITCSRACQLRAHEKHRTPIRVIQKSKRCAKCKRRFTPKRNDGRYCSGACRVAAWRQTKRCAISG